MNSCPAQYFDGQVAKANPVTIAFTDDHWIIGGDGIHLTVPAAEIEIPPGIGGATRYLRFANGARCEVDDIALENLAALQAIRSVQRQPNLISHLEQHTRILALATILIVAAATAGFFWSMPRLTARLARALPCEIEQKISKSTLATLDANLFGYTQIKYARQLKIRQAFNAFLKTTNYNGRPVQLAFRRMAGNSANAYALPNGTIVVTDGLVELANDNDEILAVVAHEIGHIENRHAIRMLLQDSAMLVLVTALTGDTSVVGNIAGALPLILTSRKFSREFETEADRYALTALQAAKIPPQRFIDILGRLENDRKQHEGDAIPRYLSTHPPTSERLELFSAGPGRVPQAP